VKSTFEVHSVSFDIGSWRVSA